MTKMIAHSFKRHLVSTYYIPGAELEHGQGVGNAVQPGDDPCPAFHGICNLVRETDLHDTVATHEVI